MHSKTIGILGGMGPAAGVYFAQKIIELNRAAIRDCEHAKFILFTNPQIPDRVNAFLESGPNPVASIVASLDQLLCSGADFGVIACNTAHIFF